MKLGVVRMFGWIILLLIVGAMAFVRLSPSDPVRWHKQAKPVGAETLKRANGYVWRRVVEGDGLAELGAIAAAAQAEPRTIVLSGSVEERQVTYVSRSLLWGFPDYTTVGLYSSPEGQQVLEVYGRLRFGRSDLGVNAKRIKGWLAAAQL